MRRALSKGNPDAIAKFKAAFTDGALKQGVFRHVADEVFGQLQAFGGYSFPKSHAAAFDVLVYQSAWLKCHHPAAFYSGLLNNQPMRFWSPAVIVNDARRHGFRILPVNIHRSADKCTLEGAKSIRLGLRYVSGIADEGRFTDLRDFCRRTHLPRPLTERLIMVGAMDGWHTPRRELIWQLGEITYAPDELDIEYPHTEVTLPDLTDADRLHTEYSILGLITGDYAMTLYRPTLRDQGVLSSAVCPNANMGM